MRKKAERDYLELTGLAIGVQKTSRDATAIGLTFTPELLKALHWEVDQTRLTVEFKNKKMIVAIATDETHFSNKLSKALSTSPSGKGRVRFSNFPDWIASSNTYSRHARFRFTQENKLEVIIPDELTTDGLKLFEGVKNIPISEAIHSTPIEPQTDNREGWGGQIRFLTEGKNEPVLFTAGQFETALDVAVRVAMKYAGKAA